MTWYEKIGSDDIRSEWTLSTAFLSAMCTVFGQQEKTESQLKNLLEMLSGEEVLGGSRLTRVLLK